MPLSQWGGSGFDADGHVHPLPAWYMPVPMGSPRPLRGWRRAVGLLVVGSFLAINAYGLCSTLRRRRVRVIVWAWAQPGPERVGRGGPTTGGRLGSPRYHAQAGDYERPSGAWPTDWLARDGPQRKGRWLSTALHVCTRSRDYQPHMGHADRGTGHGQAGQHRRRRDRDLHRPTPEHRARGPSRSSCEF